MHMGPGEEDLAKSLAEAGSLSSRRTVLTPPTRTDGRSTHGDAPGGGERDVEGLEVIELKAPEEGAGSEESEEEEGPAPPL